MLSHPSPYAPSNLGRAALLLTAGAMSFACKAEPPPPKPLASSTAAAVKSAGAKASPVISARPGVPDPNVVESRRLIGRFAKKLKAELQSGMNSGGPAKAIEVCNLKAPAIAGLLEKNPGWSIRRTSSKLRNPKNAPDAWEQKVLAQFEKEMAAGKKAPLVQHHEIVEENGTKVFRYMQAIEVGGLCLGCHGTSINQEIAAELDKRYPKDAARGYTSGQLRGAFSVRKTL